MDAAEGEALAIEVAYGAEEVQRVAVITVAKGTTIRAAIERSGLLAEFAEIDLAQNPVGVFGSVCELDDLVMVGDRVEIYRPLLADPKQARRRRAR